jgi:glycosyltransferase involved in cell wall biosynthesis
MTRYFFVLKSLALGIVFTILYPVIILLPKYDAYLFVLATGRSESARLASSYIGSPTVNAFHEPYPILNNNFDLDNKLQRAWILYQFYFIKVPLILISRLSRKKIYLETNHLFLKSFSEYALKTFGSKIKIIHLVRPVEDVVKSLYETGSYPGTPLGNKWYLDPENEQNLVNFRKIFAILEDYKKQEFEELYGCIWYWAEMDTRIDLFKWEHQADSVEIETAELDDLERLTVKLQTAFTINIYPRKEYYNIDKNLKVDEKKVEIDIEVVREKVNTFFNALNVVRLSIDDINYSVVIPLYNKERHIKKTILSVLNQSNNNFEIIIVNDGSTDNSVKIIEEFNDSRIRIINQENQGVSAARNRGINESRYDWIALLDADDEWKEEFLETMAANIIRRPECIAYTTNHEVVKSGKILPLKKISHAPKKSGIIKSYPKCYFWSAPPFHASSTILNKKLLKKNYLLDLFPVGVKLGEDLDAWMRLSLTGATYFINKKMSIYIYDALGNTSYSFNYRDEFRYSKWYKYNANTLTDSVYIKLCVIKKNIQVLKKIIKFKQYKDIPLLILDTLRVK